MKYIKVLVIFPLLSLLLGASISGFIRDKNNGEPLAYTNIILLENAIGTAADVNGYYIFPIVDDGKHTMKIMMIGYKTLERELTVQDMNLRIDIELEPTALDLDQVTVSAERMRFEKGVDISRINLTNREIRRAPAFIEADIFRTLQLLPSVSASNDFNAALIVRGGSPDENLILLDGAEVYNPYHIGGVFSTFNADMISDTEFLAGGFPAEYGGRLSSVLKITAREGDSKNGRLSDTNPVKKYWDFSKAHGDISLLSSKILAEGPLYNGSWMISGRRTYFDQFVNLYYKFKDEESPFNYYFWDTHIKFKTSPNKNNQFIYSQFSGKDDLFLSLGGDDLPGIDFSWKWGNSTKSFLWKYIPNSNYFIENNLSRTDYKFNVDFAIDFNPDTTLGDNAGVSDSDLTFDIDNIVQDIGFDQKLSYFFSDEFNIKVGWQYKVLYMDYNESFAGINRVNLNSEPSITSLYSNSIWHPIAKLHINTGVRLSKFSQYDDYLVNPRIGIKYSPVPDLALKASWGEYSQFLYTINQEDELLRIVDFWQPIPEGEKPQQSEHFIIGSEYWISEGNIFSVEAYFKQYSHIYDLNPKADGSDIKGTLALAGIGESYGLELLYRLRLDKVSGWISYAYSRIKREVDLNSDGIIWESKEIYPAKYDKPHTFNSVLSYRLSEKNEIGLSCIFSSGQTYTPVVGKVHQAGTEYYGSLENPYRYFGNVYGGRNSGRYPDYFRIDLSLIRKSNLWGLTGKWKFQIVNLTNHYNVLLYNWNHEASPSQVSAYSMFPVLVTFGWEFDI